MKILFLCTHNRCRSILADAIANQASGGKIIAASAGSHPAGQVHPMTLKYLPEFGFETEGLASQSWDEFRDFGPDAVITLCDSAAGETCPVWMSEHPRIHWGLNDPSKIEDPAEQKAAFGEVIETLKSRIETVCSWDLSNIDEKIVTDLKALGVN